MTTVGLEIMSRMGAIPVILIEGRDNAPKE